MGLSFSTLHSNAARVRITLVSIDHLKIQTKLIVIVVIGLLFLVASLYSMEICKWIFNSQILHF